MRWFRCMHVHHSVNFLNHLYRGLCTQKLWPRTRTTWRHWTWNRWLNKDLESPKPLHRKICSPSIEKKVNKGVIDGIKWNLRKHDGKSVFKQPTKFYQKFNNAQRFCSTIRVCILFMFWAVNPSNVRPTKIDIGTCFRRQWRLCKISNMSEDLFKINDLQL